MQKYIQKFIFFFLSLTLFLKILDYNQTYQMCTIDSFATQNVQLLRGVWILRDDECTRPPKCRSTPRFSASKLPDLQSPSEFSEDSDPQNEYSWDKKKKNSAAWDQYQETCQQQSKNQKSCDLQEIVSRVKENTQLLKLAKKTDKNQQIQKEIFKTIEKLRVGNLHPGIGTKTLFRNVKEARTRNGGWIYFRQPNGKIEILAKTSKVKRHQQAAIAILKVLY